jgi:hypothetical protein
MVLLALLNGKASESFVTSVQTTLRSAIADLSGRVDKVATDNASVTARVGVLEPVVKRAQVTAEQALTIATAASAASAKCGTCNGNTSGSTGGSGGGVGKGGNTPKPTQKVESVPVAKKIGEVPSDECRLVAKGPGGIANLVLKNLEGRIAILRVTNFKEKAYTPAEVLAGPKLTPMSAGTCKENKEKVSASWSEVVTRMNIPNNCSPV